MDLVLKGSDSIPPNLFSEVGFFVSGKVAPELIQLLENGGAQQKLYATVGVTHFIVGDNADQDKVDEAKDIFDIPIVAPRWISYCAKMQKPLPVHGFSGETNRLFSGLAFTSSRIRGEDLSSLWALITYHDGLYLKTLTQHTTHLLTNEANGEKFAAARNNKTHVVCIDWITDSIMAGKLLPEKSYDPIFLKTRPAILPAMQLRSQPSMLPPAPTVPVNPATDSFSTLSVAKSPKYIACQEPLLQVLPTEPNKVTVMNQFNGTDPQHRESNHWLENCEPIAQEQVNVQGMVSTEKNLTIPIPTQNHTAIRTSNPNAQLLQVSGESNQNQLTPTNPALNQSKGLPTGSDNLRAFSNTEHYEIMRQIQSDPQIKHQWTIIDHTQRTLFVQKLAQRNREERFRREMMIRQQQMQSNHLQQQQIHIQNSLPIAAKEGSTETIPTVNHVAPAANNYVCTSRSDTLTQIARSQFTVPGSRIFSPTRPPVGVTAVDFGKDSKCTENVSPIQSQQYSASSQQSHTTIIRSVASQDSSSGGSQQCSRPQVFIPRGIPVSQQRHILLTQNQTGAVFRTDGPFLLDGSQKVQGPSTPQTCVIATKAPIYHNSSNVDPHQQQPSQSKQQSPVVPAQHQQIQPFYSAQQQQQRFSVRHILVQGQVGQTPPISQVITAEPHQSQQPQPTTTQWSAGTPVSPVHMQAQRLLTTPPQQQQRPLRSSPQGQGSVIYTASPNMPHAQVVNAKTKTALANLLSNRLMGGTVPEISTPGTTVLSRSPSPHGTPVMSSPPVQNRISTQVCGKVQQVQQPLLQRRTLSTGSNGDKPSMGNNAAITPVSVSPRSSGSSSASPSPSGSPSHASRFFGHDPSLKVPDDGFLLGCVFWAAQESKIPSWEKHVLKYGGEVTSVYTSTRVTHVLCETQKFPEFQICIREGKRLVTLFWLNDAIGRRCLAVPSQAVHLPLPFTENERPYFGELISTTGFRGDEKKRVEAMCTLLGLQVTSVFTKANIGLIAKAAEGEKFFKARQWRKPVVNIQFLNELLFGHIGVIRMIHSPKYQQFNLNTFSFDVALVAPLMVAWKTPLRVNSDALERHRALRKRTVDELSDDEVLSKRLRMELAVDSDGAQLFPPRKNSDASEIELSSSQCGLQTQSTLPTVLPSDNVNQGTYVMISGFDVLMTDLFKEKIEELGGNVTEDRFVATHLISKEDVITTKLMTFLCIKDTIVVKEWLRDSYIQQRFVDATPYLARKSNLGPFVVDYSELLKVRNRHYLFNGLTFYVSPTMGKFSKDVIEAAGGTIHKSNVLSQIFECAQRSPESFVVVTCDEDAYLFKGWKEKEGVDKIIVVTRDTLLSWILLQGLNRNDNVVQERKLHILDLPSIKNTEKVLSSQDVPITGGTACSGSSESATLILPVQGN